jgi:pyridoxine kinase
MGDQGKLYVAEEVAGKYKEVVRGGECDLVLPNQFEMEVLTGREAGTLKTMKDVVDAVEEVHGWGVEHVVLTSVRLDGWEEQGMMSVVGSSKTKNGKARLWKVGIKVLEGFFSGTGDMFAALMVARLREECKERDLLGTAAWMPGDDVPAEETPLAKAAVKVLSSMQTVLEKTMVARDEEMKEFGKSPGASIGGTEGDQSTSEETREYLARTKASEVRIVRNWRDLVDPEVTLSAEAVDI